MHLLVAICFSLIFSVVSIFQSIANEPVRTENRVFKRTKYSGKENALKRVKVVDEGEQAPCSGNCECGRTCGSKVNAGSMKQMKKEREIKVDEVKTNSVSGNTDKAD